MNLDEAHQNYAKLVYKFLLSLCNDRNLAEELTQETFYQAVKSSARFDGSCKVSTWLCQIAKHLWYQEIERSKRHKASALDENLVSNQLSIEEKLFLNIEKMQIFKEVHILDPIAKEVFLLRITGAFSFREIGELFQKNENWARVTFYRAKQKIMKGRLLMKCNIIRDLFPSYVDELTSNESNIEIENHIKECTQCREILEEMKSEIVAENVEVNKNDIKPFKKLNRKVLRAVLITLTSCIFVTGVYLFLFGFGWRVQSDEISITYSKNEEVIRVNFELKDSQKALNPWGGFGEEIPHIKFTECYVGFLDDRGEHPNKFSYGMHYKDQTGKQRTFTQQDYFVIQYRDKTEKLYWKDIAEELGLQ